MPVLRGWRKKLFGDDALALKRGELALAIKKGEVAVIAPGRLSARKSQKTRPSSTLTMIRRGDRQHRSQKLPDRPRVAGQPAEAVLHAPWSAE